MADTEGPDELERLIERLRRALLARESGRPDVRVEADLARLLHGHAGGDEGVLQRMDAELDTALPLHAWIAGLPLELAEAGHVEEAVDLCTRFAPLVDRTVLLGARGEILAAAGRPAEARATAEEILRGPEPAADALLAAARIFEETEAPDRAEALYRRTLESADEDPGAALEAAERLERRLRARGQIEEAERLERMRSTWRYLVDENLERSAARFGIPVAGLFGRDDAFESEGEEEEQAAGRAPESHVLPRLLRRLYAYAAHDEFEAEQEQALREWFGEDAMPGATLEEAARAAEDESAFAAFLEWLLLDRGGPQGETLAARFAARRRAGLSAVERDLLERLGASHLGVYRVVAVREGEGFTLLDLLSGAETAVTAPEESAWILPGDLFAARLLRLDGAEQTTGSVLPLAAERLAPLLDELRAAGARGGLAAALERLAPAIARAEATD